MKLPKLHSPSVLMIGFAAVILAGAVLLMLPFSHAEGFRLAPVDALFTAVSAVCVTGLSTIPVGAALSTFGKVVLAVLIQIGGLGFMSLTVALFAALGRRIGLRERVILRDALGQPSIAGMVRLVRAIMIMTAAIELAGVLLSFAALCRYYPAGEALGCALFHSVSAFNNAGFDIFPEGASLIPFAGDGLLLSVTAALVILGGLGFSVLCDIGRRRRFRRLTMHSKIVLIMTAALLLSGMLFYMLTDRQNPLSAFFMSATARTAGFASVDYGALSAPGKLVTMALMFIGASPGSTGGGIKTTTIFTILLATFSLARGRQRTAFHRSIAAASVLKAFIVFFLALTALLCGAFCLTCFEPGLGLVDAVFECVSAIATVGLSTGITASLHVGSKIVLMLLMFLGRLGPLTIACAWSFAPPSHLSCVEEPVTVG